MPTDFRLSQAALDDIDAILATSHRDFGAQARQRYSALIAAALDHASRSQGAPMFKKRLELGPAILSWHLRNSLVRSSEERVNRPRHILYCRWEGELLAIGRVLHEVMDPRLHVDPDSDWE